MLINAAIDSIFLDAFGNSSNDSENGPINKDRWIIDLMDTKKELSDNEQGGIITQRYGIL